MTMKWLSTIVLTGWVLAGWNMFVAAGPVAAAETTARFSESQLAFFENRIRPLLANRCQNCHGPNKRESGFRVDTRGAMLSGGDSGPAIVPGKPTESLLLDVVNYRSDIKMPPEKKLSPEEIATLTEWVQQGAPWPGAAGDSQIRKDRGGFSISEADRSFWSLQPLQHTVPPTVRQTDWLNAPLDQFVLAPLEAAGFAPSAAADKRTLLRRVTLDLTGLPPQPGEIEQFLSDDSPTAYAKVIDRLLSSPHYGERWGRHWLDVVRYADTAGETGDYPVREAYLYRNWVIAAFNRDLPYDQFVRQQLAGDIMSRGKTGQEYSDLIKATGYIAISRRFGFDSENYHYLTIQDTIDTVGQSLMGLSLGCARCHHHKYDPVSIQDYYALYGIFQSTRYAFPGSEQKKRPYDMVPAIPEAEARDKKAMYDTELARSEQVVKELAARQATLQSRLDKISRGDGGFEFQALGAAPANPWTRHDGVRVTAAAQSPYQHVYGKGTRGIHLPAGGHNFNFGKAVIPVRKDSQTARLYFNIDFRNTVEGKENEGDGGYRFYLGRGPGNSAAVEMSANRHHFTVKDRDRWKIIQPLEYGQWYNLQVVLDLQQRIYSGTLSTPERVVPFRDIRFTADWDGTIDKFFVDSYGFPGGNKPAHEFDNLAIGIMPFEPLVTASQAGGKETGTVRALDIFVAQIETRRLDQPVVDLGGRQGVHVWRTAHQLPSLVVNATEQAVQIPGVVPARSVAVHPGEKTAAAIAWRSPFAGRVQVTGRISDQHNCGDSVLWTLDHQAARGFRALAQGDVTTGQAGQLVGGGSVDLGKLEVQQGDLLQLAVFPKAHYGCDLTGIEWEIRELDGRQRVWNLARDIVSDLHQGGRGNPHSDSHGNAATWYFYELSADRGASWSSQRNRFDVVISDADRNLQQQLTAVNAEHQQATAHVAALRSRELPYQVIYAVREGEPVNAQIHRRGDFKRLGDVVQRRFPRVLGGADVPADYPGSGRALLADWILDTANPLTARVIVNRLWQWHFGRALVRTPNDFGRRGQLPTHPELLDFLAQRFLQHGWSMKAMHRMILQSAAYQSSGRATDRLLRTDPENRLVGRFGRRRLDAEMIRDALLVVAGNLDKSTGGEHPFPDVNSWGFSQHAPFKAVYDHDQRSVYLMVQRQHKHPFLSLFDGPDPNASTPQRVNTTVPTQALYMLNSPFFHRQCEDFARRLYRDHTTDQKRLEVAYEMAYGRLPASAELASAQQFLRQYRKQLTDVDGETRELRLWSAYARILLASNEFLYVD